MAWVLLLRVWLVCLLCACTRAGDSTGAGAGAETLAPRWSTALFLKAGAVHVLRLSVDSDDLRAINAEAKDRCDSLENSEQVHLAGMDGPVRSSVSADDLAFRACAGLRTEEDCWLSLDILGPKRVPGICTDSFNTNFASGLKQTLMCVPVEAYGATQSCQGKDARVGDSCTIGDGRVEFAGVCGNDQQVRPAPPRAARVFRAVRWRAGAPALAWV